MLAANSRSFKTDADLVPYPWNEDCDLTLELKQPPRSDHSRAHDLAEP